MKKLDYNEWLKEARQYENAGRPSADAKFSPTILYNILSMSLESYCMAIMDKHGYLPENHTFYDLVNGLENVISVDKSLKDRILDLEKYQELCSLQVFRVAAPDHAAIVELRDVVSQLSKIAQSQCLS